MTEGYIYLLQEREFIRLDEPTYKVGKTRQEDFGRIKQYPKGSKLLSYTFSHDIDKDEKRVIFMLRENYDHKKEYGYEYFGGCYKAMIMDIVNVLMTPNTTLEDDNGEAIIIKGNKIPKDEVLKKRINEKKLINDMLKEERKIIEGRLKEEKKLMEERLKEEKLMEERLKEEQKEEYINKLCKNFIVVLYDKWDTLEIYNKDKVGNIMRYLYLYDLWVRFSGYENELLTIKTLYTKLNCLGFCYNKWVHNLQKDNYGRITCVSLPAKEEVKDMIITFQNHV